MESKAVVIFSGGQDSTTCLIQAQSKYDSIHCITFDYGQRHKQEIKVAQHIAQQLNIKHHKIVDATVINSLAISSLTRENIEVSHELQSNGLPNSFVPGRNILFMTLAAMYAYQVGAQALITGVCETDFSGYPDCRNDFVQAQQKALQLGMDSTLTIKTPLMWLNKAQTWALADRYGKLDFIRHQTLTCYNGVIGDGCQTCPACELRENGLQEYLSHREKIQHQLDELI